MRATPMTVVPLEKLVVKLKQDRFAYNSEWSVYCAKCERYFDILPDKAGILCGWCGEPLVALVPRTMAYLE